MSEYTKKGKQEAGVCPVCKKDGQLDYGDMDLSSGNSIGYEFTCDNCGAEGIEWYDLTYSETLVRG